MQLHYWITKRRDYVDRKGLLRIHGDLSESFYGLTSVFITHTAGIIDEVALYDAPLSEGEVQTHYQNVINGKGYFDAYVNSVTTGNTSIIWYE